MKRQSVLWTLVLALAVLVAAPARLLAQAQTTGSITGRVAGQDGAPIAGAQVTAESVDTGAERTATTDANGKFLFPLVQVGNWTLTVTATGMQPQVSSFRVGVGETVPIDTTLLPGDADVSEEVTVYAATAATSFETPEIRENLDYREEIEQLPLFSRDINVVANLAPHVSSAGQNRDEPTATNVSIAGAPSMDTTVLLDGAEISNPYFGSGTNVYLEDAIEEVQVLVSGVSARYGRFQGGIINAITKSGTNNYEASLRYEFSQESWNETTPFGEGQSDDLNEVYQATLGGFILRDHLWFFGGYRDFDLSQVATTRFGASNFDSSTNEDRWQIKVRGAPWANHTIEASYLEFDSEVTNWFFPGFPVGDLAATNGQRHDPRDSATLSYQGVLTSNLFLELQATEKNETQTIGGQPGDVDPILNAGGGAGGTAVYGNYWWDSTDNSDRDNETQSGIISYHIPGERAGSHNLEGGVQLVSSITQGRNQQSATGYNYLSLNPDFVAGTNAAGETLFNVRSFAALRFVAQPVDNEQILDDTSLFVQDSIDLGKWRFDVGARWEQYEGDGALAEENVDFDKIVPRLAATYDINDRWQVTGSFAQYAARFNDIFAQGITGVSAAARSQDFYFGPDALGITAAQVAQITRTDAFWPLVTFYNGPGIQNNYLADDVNMPYADEWGLSMRYALPKRSGTVVLSYVDREYEDLMTDFLGGVCDFPGIFSFQHETETCPGANTTDILGPTGAVINQADTLVWANDPRAVRDYQGLAAQIQWRPSSQSQIGGSVTFSSQSANYSGEAATQPADGGTLGTFVRAKTFGGTTFEDSAPVLDVDAQRARLWGGYTFDFDRLGNLNFTGLLTGDWTAGSGTSALASAYNYSSVPEYLGETGGFYALFFDETEPPASHGYAHLDLAARYDVAIFGKFGVWVKATVLNVTNEDELLSAGRAGVQNGLVNGVPAFIPFGNCGLDSEPSRGCTGWNSITSENNYARPREYLFTIGFRY